MTTKLDGELKRELRIGDAEYTIRLSPEGFTLALKGRRKGLELRWLDLVSGDAALATALNASLTANLRPQAKGEPRTQLLPATSAEKSVEAAKPSVAKNEASPPPQRPRPPKQSRQHKQSKQRRR